MLILLDPGVQFKAIEGDTLDADRNLGEIRANLGIKPIAVHAEVERSVAEADEARKKGWVSAHYPASRAAAQATPNARWRTCTGPANRGSRLPPDEPMWHPWAKNGAAHA